MCMCDLYVAHNYSKSRQKIHAINSEHKFRTLEYAATESSTVPAARKQARCSPKNPPGQSQKNPEVELLNITCTKLIAWSILEKSAQEQNY